VREIHNLSVIDVGEAGAEVSLHLKLPGDLRLDEAHAVAESVEREIVRSVHEVVSVQTHLEPLGAPAEGRDVTGDELDLTRAVRECAGEAPRETRVLHTDDGLVVFLTLGLPPGTTLEDAHARASSVEARIRAGVAGLADVIVHTEP
jgi:divalent metal cation (Fe/Co/Zn/Cd) transporter